jgi:cytidylate kinase
MTGGASSATGPDTSTGSGTGARAGVRILVDGRSGSGKTRLAAALVAARPVAQLLRLDDLYPGWDGLAAGYRMLHDDVLAASDPSWRRWDWVAGAPAERHRIDPAAPLVVEGAGALGRATRPYAALAVWVELDGATRKRRALARDGDAYAPHWDRWAAQEAAFIAAEQPARLADLVVDGTDVDAALPAVLAAVDAALAGRAAAAPPPARADTAQPPPPPTEPSA